MIFSKVKIHKILEGFKLKYILLEILLIFIGVSLASFFNERLENKENQKFVKENLVLYKSELEDNMKANEFYFRSSEEQIKKLDDVLDKLYGGQVKNLSEEEKKSLMRASHIMYLQNKQIGLSNILNRDINLIKDKKLITQISEYQQTMKGVTDDLSHFNKERDGLRFFYRKHLVKMDYDKITFHEINDKTSFLEDIELQNQLIYANFCMLVHLESYQVAYQPRTEELIASINKYLDK